MTAVQSVLVVGGGSAGNAVTLFLRQDGTDVTVIDADPDWGALGSGITLCGNALRVLGQAGVWPEVSETFQAAPAEMDLMKLGGPDYPGVGGMQRQTLQGILAKAVRASGATVRLGLSVRSLQQIGDRVDVEFTDGSAGSYDLVIGADGINSAVRALVGIEQRPQRIGMSIFRVCVPRFPGAVGAVTRHDKFHIVGMTLTSPADLYSYVVEPSRDPAEVRALGLVAEVHRIAQDLPEPFRTAFGSVSDAEQVDYRSFHQLNLGTGCYRGRVVIIGDAAHVCPPTLAQGAAMALEDAAVLAEMLAAAHKLDDDLLGAYARRRDARVRPVVDISVRLCAPHEDPAVAQAAFIKAMRDTAFLAQLP